MIKQKCSLIEQISDFDLAFRPHSDSLAMSTVPARPVYSTAGLLDRRENRSEQCGH